MRGHPETRVTPLFLACERGSAEIVDIFLRDPRTDPNLSKKDRTSPLWIACSKGHQDVVERLLASHFSIDAPSLGIRPYLDPALAAFNSHFPALGSLVVEYRKNPRDVRVQLRRKLGFQSL